MADPEHLKILQEGVEKWNEWREENPKIVPDLIEADLSHADLEGADLCGAYLCRANLFLADLEGAHLSYADLREARLDGAHLEGANLSNALLGQATLIGAHLRGANLYGAELYGTNFCMAGLKGANFHVCSMTGATFTDVDLSQAVYLEWVQHLGPSSIGIDTIYRSQGKIPEIFLHGAGVPENFIVYMRSLAAEPFDYYSCFISFSSKDEDFAKLLHGGLQQEGIRCWFAPEDLKIGDKFRQRIDEAILIYDKLLVVLSENSIQSSWVEEEVESALEKERRQKKLVLFPVRLDDAVMETNLAWAASLRRTRHIAKFTQWKEHDHYQTAFKRLLRDLQGEAAKGASARETD